MADDTGFYVGANVGRVLRTYRLNDIDNGVIAAFENSGNPVVLSSSSLRKDHVMWTADVGYMVSRNFGIEASYLHLGSLAYSTSGTETAGSTAVSLKLDIKSRGPALAAVAVLPMSNWWTVDGHLGAYEGKTIATDTTATDANSQPGTQSKTSTSLLAGVGTAFTVSSHCALRADYIRLQSVKEAALGRSFNVDLVTAGVVFVF
jgi:hypothetical protein